MLILYKNDRNVRFVLFTNENLYSEDTDVLCDYYKSNTEDDTDINIYQCYETREGTEQREDGSRG